MRHFSVNWGLRWYGNAKDLLANAPSDSVDVYYDGNSTHPPVPGDMIVFDNGGLYGHVALVTAVTSSAVYVMEQNTTGDGTRPLSRSGGNVSAGWSGWWTKGWAHAKANTSSSPRRVDADVNGDGRADLVSLHSGGSAYSWPGLSGGTFGGAVASFAGTMNPALFDKNGHYVVDAADVDGNGTADLVTVYSDGTSYVYAGSSTGFSGGVASFAGTLQLWDVSGVGHHPVGVADVTGDGKADLVTVHSNGYVYVFPGTSSRTFGGAVASFGGTFNSALYDKTGHYVVDVADVTGDGKADLVTVNSTGYAYVFPGTATGAFGSAVGSFGGTLQVALVGGVGHEPVAAADVTGDGKADLVTVNTNGYAYVFPGTSTGAFGGAVASFGGTLNTSLFDGTGHEVIGALDITGDGKADLVTTAGGYLYVYPGTSTGAFGSGVGNFGGTLDASRFDGVGHEFASERILSRRRGCSASGC